MKQKLIIHNQTDNDIHIEIKYSDDTKKKNTLFYVPTERLLTQAQNNTEIEVSWTIVLMLRVKNDNCDFETLNINTIVRGMEIDILYCSPSAAGENECDLNIILLEHKIQTIFKVLGKSHTIQKSIDLKNLLACPLRIKAQLQQKATINSELTIDSDELNLKPTSIAKFYLPLKPGSEIHDVDVCPVIDSAKNLKWLKVD
ncbi:unnamed protein product [Didymodactylos carnosus]|uniref:Uncharacterized protein n=1 Tax=Didymodactylos carnosus TaxID=1234261 RepID=A0A814Z9L2_9BILA|nr:unnamed protein product [Didymodactylos carnosus]CAF4002310.1 unnamed protein product [Didymodactylos carnosus]